MDGTRLLESLYLSKVYRYSSCQLVNKSNQKNWVLFLIIINLDQSMPHLWPWSKRVKYTEDLSIANWNLYGKPSYSYWLNTPLSNDKNQLKWMKQKAIIWQYGKYHPNTPETIVPIDYNTYTLLKKNMPICHV